MGNGRIATIVLKICTCKKWKESPERRSHMWASQKWGRYILAFSCTISGGSPPSARKDPKVRFRMPVEFSVN
jgi:hypothetical protein